MRVQAMRKRVHRMQRRYPAPPDGYMSFDEWKHMRDVIVEALKPFPGARVAVAEALMDVSKRAIP